MTTPISERGPTQFLPTEPIPQEGDPSLLKWTRAGLTADTYLANPQEAKKLIAMHLHHQISYYGHEVKANSEGHLEILCNGQYRPVSEVLADLESNGKSLVSVRDGIEWNYLPQGLVQWNLMSWGELKPITRLSAEQLAVVQERARKLPSPILVKEREQKLSSPLIERSEKPPFVLQLVSSWNGPEGSNSSGTALTTEASLSQHPWIRLITPEGDLYSVGFSWGKELGGKDTAETVSSSFRSPDLWETFPVDTRMVTNIEIDEEQFTALKKEIESDNQEGIAFNLIIQNCSTYVEHILRKIGFTVEFQMRLGELFWRNLPVPLRTTIEMISKPCRDLASFLENTLPSPLIQLAKQVAKVVNTVLNFFANIGINTLIFCLGGRRGVEFPQIHRGYINQENNQAEPLQPQRIVRIFDSAEDFFVKENDHIYHPFKVAEWQMKQPSTIHLDGRQQRRFYKQFDPVFHSLFEGIAEFKAFWRRTKFSNADTKDFLSYPGHPSFSRTFT